MYAFKGIKQAQVVQGDLSNNLAHGNSTLLTLSKTLLFRNVYKLVSQRNVLMASINIFLPKKHTLHLIKITLQKKSYKIRFKKYDTIEIFARFKKNLIISISIV